VPSSKLRWLVPIALTILAVAVGVGVLGRDLYRQRAQAAPPPVYPSNSSVPLEKQPGDPQVHVTSDVFYHPLYDQVTRLIQTFFDSINLKSYDKWKLTATRSRIDAIPRNKWETDYQSSHDGSIVIYRIQRTGPETAIALISFTSTQDVADAPPEFPEHCIKWHNVVPLALESGQWKMSSGPAGQAPQRERC